MPFYLWLAFGLFDWHYKFVDEYYAEFGAGPGYESFQYTLDGRQDEYQSWSVTGAARVGVLLDGHWGVFTGVGGGDNYGGKRIPFKSRSLYIDGGLGGSGLGLQYTHKKTVYGISLDYGSTHVLANEDSPEDSISIPDELFASDFAAVSLFAQYEITDFTWWDFLWFKHFNSRINAGPTLIFNMDGGYNVGLVASMSIGWRPHHK